MSNYRHDRNNADAALSIKIAEVLGINPITVIADIQQEAARTDKSRAFWSKYSSAAAVLLSILGFVSTYTNANAATPPYSREYSVALYIMSNNVRRLKQASKAIFETLITFFAVSRYETA